MGAYGYTYREIAEAAYSLVEEQASTILTDDGYFNRLDIALAIENTERDLFLQLAKRDPGYFIRMQSGLVYGAGSTTRPIVMLTREPVTALIAVEAKQASGADSEYYRLRKVSLRNQWTMRYPATGIGLPTGFVFAGEQLRLMPTPTVDMHLLLTYQTFPRRLRVANQSGGADVGGFASGSDEPCLPSWLQHLLPLGTAIYLEAKRRSEKTQLLVGMYAEQRQTAFDAMTDYDQTEPNQGSDLESDGPEMGAGSSFVYRRD